jgi:hypothetical protein
MACRGREQCAEGRALPATCWTGSRGCPPGASLRLGRSRRPTSTRGEPRRSCLLGSTAVLWYPRPVRSETERPVHPSHTNSGGRSFVERGHSLGELAAGHSFPVSGDGEGVGVLPAGQGRDDLLGGPLGQRRAARQHLGAAEDLRLELVGCHQSVDETAAQGGLGVDEFTAEQEVLRRRRADQDEQDPARRRGIDDADPGGVTPKIPVGSVKRRSQVAAISTPPPPAVARQPRSSVANVSHCAGSPVS